MASGGSNIFHAVIQATDAASGPIRRVAANLGALGPLTTRIGEHARGMGHLLRSAFGEAEEGGHHAGHAGHAAAEGFGHAERALHGTAAAAGEAAAATHRLGTEAHRAGAEIQHAAHVRSYEALGAHIRLLRGHFGELSVSAGEFGHSVSEFLPQLAALGAAGSLVGLFEMTEHAAEGFSKLSSYAAQAGMSVEKFNALSIAASTVDVPVDRLTHAMGRLNERMGQALAGRNKDVAALFKQLHISLRNAHGGAVSAADAFPKLVDAIKHIGSETMRARMAMALFGRAGLELAPIFKMGREELESLSEEAARASFVPSGEEGEKLESYHRSLTLFQASVGGLTTEIGTKLAPVLQPIVDGMRHWIDANRDWISSAITDKVKELRDWLSQVDWKAAGDKALAWGKTISDVMGTTWGFDSALGALALALGSPLLSGIAAAIAAFGALGRALKALAVLAWENPIIIAVAAVAIAAYELWAHWDTVKAALHAVWEAIKSAWHATANALVAALVMARHAIVAIFTGIGHGMMAALVWIEGKLGSAWRAMTGGLSGALGAAWDRMRPLLDRLKDAAQLIVDAWSRVKQFFVDMWKGIGDAFRDAWSTIKPYVDDITGAVDGLRNGWFGRHLGLGDSPATAPSRPAPGPDLLHRGLYGRQGMLTPSPSSDVAAAPPMNGTVRTEITINGLPPGSTVRSTASGAAAPPDIDVGYSLSGLAGAF